MSVAAIVRADLTWLDGRFQPNVRVTIDGNGRIAAAGVSEDPPTRRLTARALAPGMVNVHSHAFQRGLRGSGEHFPRGPGSFWTWRDGMYRLASSLDSAHLGRVCRQAFREMLASGITTVGEFHYLHHDGPDEDYLLDEQVLEAAADVGIRLVLLQTAYQTGGIGRGLDQGQQRFATRSLDRFWKQIDRLAGMTTPRQSLGVAAHSVRAVQVNDIRAIHDEAKRRQLPFHMHIEETRREIEECITAYGKTPLGVINDQLAIDSSLTAVHCTHSRPDEIDTFVQSGGRICICPLTEANLGDGIPSIDSDSSGHAYLSVGTDSNARICFPEELRWLEYGQRLRIGKRGALIGGTGDVPTTLFEIATRGGAAALALDAGEIRPGAWADFFTIDLEHPSMAPITQDQLLTSFLMGTGTEAIDQVCIGGEWRDARL